MLVLVALRISEIIVPPFPNKQPTWLGETTSLAVTGDPLLEPGSRPFSMPDSTALEKTSTIVFCAAEYRDSGFCGRRNQCNSSLVLLPTP
jgi:hypothetical protein